MKSKEPSKEEKSHARRISTQLTSLLLDRIEKAYNEKDIPLKNLRKGTIGVYKVHAALKLSNLIIDRTAFQRWRFPDSGGGSAPSS